MSNPWDFLTGWDALNGGDPENIYNALDPFERDIAKYVALGDVRAAQIFHPILSRLQSSKPDLFLSLEAKLDIPGMTARSLSSLIQGDDRALVISAAIERGRRLERRQLHFCFARVLTEHAECVGTFTPEMSNLALHVSQVIKAGKYVPFQESPERPKEPSTEILDTYYLEGEGLVKIELPKEPG